jgi:hypothetical protein
MLELVGWAGPPSLESDTTEKQRRARMRPAHVKPGLDQQIVRASLSKPEGPGARSAAATVVTCVEAVEVP